ncbi:hypothetical protein AZE42_12306 [Rhizopogon vesiculosus]|uniref:Uncharacterized protein n=1 Tax=Rhizopogon vesiculosus TaxID=180088 RepID=A0A1J8QCW1_9AGAM|nr:hypothetical protein AZE42_12306 [Rhizopogon vesiculosus]
MRSPISLATICLTTSDVFRFVEYVMTPWKGRLRATTSIKRELESCRAELSSVLVQHDHDGSIKQAAPRLTPYPTPSRPQRPSSYPPVGAEPVKPSTDIDSWAPFLVTHDDLAHRLSRTTMYHSVTSAPLNHGHEWGARAGFQSIRS